MTVEKQIHHIENITKAIKQITLDELADQRLVEVLEVIESYSGELKNILTKRINTAKQLADVRKDEVTLHNRWEKASEYNIWLIIDKLTDIANNNETIAQLVKQNLDNKPAVHYNGDIIEITNKDENKFWLKQLTDGLTFTYDINLTIQRSKALIFRTPEETYEAKQMLDTLIKSDKNYIIRSYTVVHLEKKDVDDTKPEQFYNCIAVQYKDACYYWLKKRPVGDVVTLDCLTKIKKNAMFLTPKQSIDVLNDLSDNYMPTELFKAEIESI